MSRQDFTGAWFYRKSLFSNMLQWFRCRIEIFRVTGTTGCQPRPSGHSGSPNACVSPTKNIYC